MYVDNWETQAKTTLMSINKYLYVCGQLGDSSQKNVNGYQQIFTCIWELGEEGGTQANNVNVSQQIFTCTWGLGGLKLKQR